MTKKIFDRQQILNSLKDNGYAIIEDYFDIDFCNKAILEIESSINLYKNETHLTNGSGGDIRFYKFERVSNCAEIFSKDQFLLSIGEEYFEKKLSTHFVLGGKLEFSAQNNVSSGGGWHRDSDGIQFKAMVYLNDVKSNNGPFLFVTNSKTKDAKRESIENFNSLTYLDISNTPLNDISPLANLTPNTVIMKNPLELEIKPDFNYNPGIFKLNIRFRLEENL